MTKQYCDISSPLFLWLQINSKPQRSETFWGPVWVQEVDGGGGAFGLGKKKERKKTACPFNDEKKKKLGLTGNIWYSTGGEASVRGSWLRNKRRQEKGTCGSLGGWGFFFLSFFFLQLNFSWWGRWEARGTTGNQIRDDTHTRRTYTEPQTKVMFAAMPYFWFALYVGNYRYQTAGPA